MPEWAFERWVREHLDVVAEFSDDSESRNITDDGSRITVPRPVGVVARVYLPRAESGVPTSGDKL